MCMSCWAYFSLAHENMRVVLPRVLVFSNVSKHSLVLQIRRTARDISYSMSTHYHLEGGRKRAG